MPKKSKGQPRPGLIHELSLRMTDLQSKLAATESALERSRARNEELSCEQAVSVELDSSGFLLIHLPGAHTLRWALGNTHSDYAVTMTALVRLLEARRESKGLPNPVGSPGAPTQAHLRALAMASRKPVTKIAASGRSGTTSDKLALTLDDLGL